MVQVLRLAGKGFADGFFCGAKATEAGRVLLVPWNAGRGMQGFQVPTETGLNARLIGAGKNRTAKIFAGFHVSV